MLAPFRVCNDSNSPAKEPTLIDFEQYVKDACTTESPGHHLHKCGSEFFRTLHAVVGLVTEAGEMMDMLKKTVFYGKDFDRTNLIEELGDMMWYAAILCSANGIDFSEVLRKNIAKLKARYPDKFTEHSAANRDLENERNVLEKA